MGAPVSSRLSCPVKLCMENQIVCSDLGIFGLTLEHVHRLYNFPSGSNAP